VNRVEGGCVVNGLIERYRYFLMDLWGVVWDGGSAFPEAIAVCHAIRESGGLIRFVSNCAEFTAEDLLGRLHAGGLTEAELSWLATSGQAMKRWFEQRNLAGKDVYVFGGPAVHENTRRAGASVLSLPEDPLEILDNRVSDTLVIGGHYDFRWNDLKRLVSCVRLGKLRIVLPNPDRIVVRDNGTVDLPAGMIVQIVRNALPDVVVEPIGKPYEFLFDYALETLGVGEDRSRVLMIGDSMETDILGANRSRIDSLLIGNGVHAGQSHEEVLQLGRHYDARPTYYTRRLSSAEVLIQC